MEKILHKNKDFKLFKIIFAMAIIVLTSFKVNVVNQILTCKSFVQKWANRFLFWMYVPKLKSNGLSLRFLYLALFGLMLQSTNVLAQGTPGGVAGSVLWYNSKAGVTPGATFTWTNHGTLTADAVQSTAASQPALINSGSSQINFNPVVQFDGTNDYLSTPVIADVLGTNAGSEVSSQFAVYRRINDTQNNNNTVYQFGGASSAEWRAGLGNANGMNQQGFFRYKGTLAANEVALIDMVSSTSSSSSNLDYQKNGIGGVSSGGTYTNNPTNKNFNIGGESSNSYNSNIDVAEIVIYPALLSAAERRKVQSYLAIKYGISLGDNVTAEDYTSSSGAVVWAASTTYKYDIFGIGKDDAGNLNQSQSNSINTGSGDGTGQSGKGNIVLSNPSSLTDGDFLMIGHDNGALEYQYNDLPASMDLSGRLGREWKVKHTGDIGTVDLTFNTTGLSNSGSTVDRYLLLIDTDGDGDFTTGSTTTLPASSLTNNILLFDNITLSDNVVFTLVHNQVPGTGTLTPLQATGGSGNFKNAINWITLSAGEIAAGEVLTSQVNINGIDINIIIDRVSFSGLSSVGLPNTRLVAYRPGSWSGDKLDDLYNIGGTEGSNTLKNGLVTNANGGGGGLLAKFRVRAYGTMNGAPVDLGFVYANAEADANNEYNQGTTNGDDWQLLEKGVFNTTANRSVFLSQGNNPKTARIRGNENVALMYSQKQATSQNDPLEIDVEFVSGGTTAVAFGVFSVNDIGDGAASFGVGSHAFTPVVTGGGSPAPASATEYYLDNATCGITVLDAATTVYPVSPRFGLLAGDPDPSSGMQSNLANADDQNGVDDEDGLVSPALLSLSAGPLNIDISSYNSSGTTANIYAWVDFNRNGVFEANEASNAASQASNSTQATQTLVFPFAGALSDGTYPLRIRITTETLTDDLGTPALDERSMKITKGGETEDYLLNNSTSGPGGVVGSFLWYDSKAGVTPGATFTWANHGALTADAVQSTAASQPALINSGSSQINFNPVVQFDGTNDYLSTPVIADVLGTNAGSEVSSQFAVYRRINATQNNNNAVYQFGGAASTQWRAGLGNANGMNQQGFSRYKGTLLANEVALIDMVSSTSSSSSNLDYQKNGIGGFSSEGTYTNNPANKNFNIGGETSSSYNSNIDVAEIVIYPAQLSAADRRKVQSYLAIKYGISLGDNYSAEEYTSSSGAVVWASNATYKYDIFGIGKDDAGNLNQSQSNSINTGSGDGTGQSSKGNIVLSNPSSLTDGTFLMLGHDNGGFTQQITEVPVAGKWRIKQEWLVKRTGDPGTVNLSFDIAGLTLTGNTAADFKLLIDADGDFSSGATVVDAASLTGTKVAYTGVSIPDGSYLTFVTGSLQLAGPGGVVGSFLWYDSKAGVTPGATFTWANHGALTADAVQSTAASQPALINSGSSQINFNPVVQFDGTNDYLSTPVIADVLGTNAGSEVSSQFAVYRRINDTQNNNNAVYQFGGASSAEWRAGLGNANGMNQQGFFRYKGTLAANEVALIDMVSSTSSTSSNLDYQKNGIGGVSSGGTYTNNPTNKNFNIGGESSNSYNSNIDVAEIVIYPALLSATERRKVQSYLAIKYGISLGDNTTAEDYTSSSGAVVWTSNTTYKYDIFGIGKDDAGNLNQSQSNSINTGSGDGTGQSGKGNIVLSNPSSLDDGDFMMIGHDNAALTEQTTEVPTAGQKRVAREWFVKRTGDPGTVDLSFDIEGLTFASATATDFKLLIDSDGDFSSGATAVNATSLNGTKVNFNGVSLPNDSYFTFETSSSTLSVNDFDSDAKVLAYSSNNKLMVKSIGTTLKAISVFDVMGRKLVTYHSINKNEVTLEKLNKTNTLLFLVIELSNGMIVNKKVIY